MWKTGVYPFAITLGCCNTAIWAVKAFSLIYSMTEGGPANSSHILGTLAYNLAFRYGHLGRGSAVGVVMASILIAIGALWIRRELRRWER